MGPAAGGRACWVEGGGDAGLAARAGASLIGPSEQWSAAPSPKSARRSLGPGPRGGWTPASALPGGLAGPRLPRRAGARSWIPGAWRGPRRSRLRFINAKIKQPTLGDKSGGNGLLGHDHQPPPARHLSPLARLCSQGPSWRQRAGNHHRGSDELLVLTHPLPGETSQPELRVGSAQPRAAPEDAPGR